MDRIARADDLIVYKLLADRPRDRSDIDEILRSGVELDREYIESWASDWGVIDRWAQALNRLDRGIDPPDLGLSL